MAHKPQATVQAKAHAARGPPPGPCERVQDSSPPKILPSEPGTQHSPQNHQRTHQALLGQALGAQAFKVTGF